MNQKSRHEGTINRSFSIDLRTDDLGTDLTLPRFPAKMSIPMTDKVQGATLGECESTFACSHLLRRNLMVLASTATNRTPIILSPMHGVTIASLYARHTRDGMEKMEKRRSC